MNRNKPAVRCHVHAPKIQSSPISLPPWLLFQPRRTRRGYGSVFTNSRQTQSALTLNNVVSRTNTTTYDYLGNATKIEQTNSLTDEIFAEFGYNPNGLLTSVNRYEVDDNLVTSVANTLYTYNANNAITSITHKNPDTTPIVQHSYTYDETNNIVEYLNSLDGQTSYDYDFLGQLVSADYANASISDEFYTYEENGNRITANGDTYTTGTNNELTSDGDFTYTYDAEGNRISKTNAANTERELYTWDYRNRLTTVTKQTYDTLTNEWTTVQIVEYSYDYNNVWIRKTVGNNSTIFIPENYQTTVQIDNGTTTHHYLWTPNQQDKLLADTTSADVLWSLTDHLGTVRDILGSEDVHLIYDAFGKLISGSNPLLFGYTGKAFDSDTNLQNNINRWYDATIGRWLSIDPIGFEGNDTNLYRYTQNKPLSTLDLNGLYAKDVHFYLNYVMAMYLGLTDINDAGVSDAYMIAWLAQQVDENSSTDPFSGHDTRQRFHFPDNNNYFIYGKGTIRNALPIRKKICEAAASGNIAQFGVLLHIYEDTWAHSGYGDAWGHAIAGTNPDNPFLHQERDKQMLLEVFKCMT